MIAHTKSRKKIIILASVFVLALAAGGGYWYLSSRNNKNDDKTQQDTEQVNKEPATEEEKQEVEQTKDKLASENEQNSTQSSSEQKNASVTITYAGQYGSNIEAGAFVGNVFEDNGTCTFTLSKGSKVITRTTKGFKDVSSTTCPPLEIPRSDLPEAGSWVIRVSYESPSVSGKSTDKTIEVK